MNPLFPDEAHPAQSSSAIPLTKDVIDVTPINASTSGNVPAVRSTTALVPVGDKDIEQLGEANANSYSQLTDRLLKDQRAADAGQLGSQLNELIATAKGLDPKNMQKGVIGKLRGLFGNMKEQILSQTDSITARMDTLVGEMDKTVALHRQRLLDMDELEKANALYHQNLVHDADTGRAMIATLQQQLDNAPAPKDAFEAQGIERVKKSIVRLETMVENFENGKLRAKQVAGEIDDARENARGIVQTFVSAKRDLIPAWKMALVQNLIGMEQKQSIQLGNNLKDSLEEAMRAQAGQLHQNTIDQAKLQQRENIPLSVLEDLQKQMIETADKVKAIEDEGRARRAANAPRRAALEQQLIEHVMKS